MTKLAVILAVVAAFAAPALAGADELLINGGFENPALPVPSWTTFPSIPGWSSTGTFNIEIQASLWTPFEGTQYIELDSYGNELVWATGLTAVAGQKYHLSFAYSPRPYVPIYSNPVDVFWEGGLIASITADGTFLSNTEWTVYDFDLIAHSTAPSLMFLGDGLQDSLGGFIDGVSLTGPTRAVPEPATMALLGVGALGLALRRRKLSA